MSLRRHAILIGSSDYPNDAALPTLRCPSRDVEGLKEVLSSPEYGKFNEIHTFINVPHYKIIKDINFTLRQADRNDLILIYYSGHGKLDPLGRLHLATVDTELDALEGTSIPVASIKNYIDVSRSREIILILDCCYSGRIKDAFIKGGADEQLKGTFIKGGVDEQLQQVQGTQEGKGIYILTASTGIQVAQEKEGDKYSIFTKHIIEGIKGGEADIDDDGKISVHDLYRYTYDRMRKETALHYPMRWDVHVEGQELVVAYTGRGPGQKQRDKIRKVILSLYDNGSLPRTVLVEALDILESDVIDSTATNVSRQALLGRLVETQIKVGEFIDRWYASGKRLDEDEIQSSLTRLLNDARAAIDHASWGRAADLLKKVLALNPSHSEAQTLLTKAEKQLELLTHYNAGLAYYESGHWNEALASFQQILASASDYKNVKLLVVNAQNEIAKIKEERQRQYEIDTLLQKAESAIASQDWDSAIRHLQTVLGIAPEHGPALTKLREAQQGRLLLDLYNNGLELLKAECWQDAISYLNQIREAQGNYRDTDRLIVKAQAEIAKAKEADRRREEIAALREEVERLIVAENWLKAEGKLQAILASDASDVRALEQLRHVRRQNELHSLYSEAQERLASGQWDKSLSLLRKVNGIDGNYKDVASLISKAESEAKATALYNEARMYMGREEWGKAITKLQELLAATPSYRSEALEMAYTATQKQEEERLKRQYAEGLEHYKKGRWVEALKIFQDVRKADAGYAEVNSFIEGARHEIERINQENRRRDETTKLFVEVDEAIKGRNWEAARNKLRAVRGREYDAKVAEYLESIAQGQREQESKKLYGAAVRHYKSGNWPEAVTSLERLITLDPRYKDAATLLNSSKAEIEKSELEHRRRQEQESKEKAKQLDNEAQDCIRRADWDSAIDKLTEAKALDDTNKTIAFHLEYAQHQKELSAIYATGREYYESGKYKDALTNFKRVAKLENDYKDIKDLIAAAEIKLEEARQWPPRSRLLLWSVIGAVLGLAITSFIIINKLKAGSITNNPATPHDDVITQVNLKALYQISVQSAVHYLELSSNGRVIASVTDNPLVTSFWQADGGKDLKLLSNSPVNVNCGGATVSHTEEPLGAFGCSDGNIRLLNLNEGRAPILLKSRFGLVFILSFSADGRTLVSGSVDPKTNTKAVQVWQLERDWTLKYSMEIAPVDRLSAISADHNLIAVVTPDGIELRSLIEKTFVKRLDASKNFDGASFFSPDGKVLAVPAGGEAKVFLWRVSDGSLIGKPLESAAGIILSVAVSPDGQLLAGGDKGGGIQVWRLGDGQRLAAVQAHVKGEGKEVRALAFSANGQYLASAGTDNLIKLWQIVKK